LEILNNIGIPRCRLGYKRTDDDLAYLTINIIKIIKGYDEKNNKTVKNTAIVYYKPNQ